MTERAPPDVSRVLCRWRRNRPMTKLITPAGTPAFSAKATAAMADNGVAFAGLMTAVQPAAKADRLYG